MIWKVGSRAIVREAMESSDELQNWNPVMNFNLLDFTDTKSFRVVFSSNLSRVVISYKTCIKRSTCFNRSLVKSPRVTA